MKYDELVKALRSASTISTAWEKLMHDAAAAIEELEAKVPHWVSVKEPPKGNGAFAACCVYDGKIYWFKAIYLDGKWLREMDGVELPVNYWMEIPQPPQEVQDGK